MRGGLAILVCGVLLPLAFGCDRRGSGSGNNGQHRASGSKLSPASRSGSPERIYDTPEAGSDTQRGLHPGDKGTTAADVATTHRIRQALMADEQLAPVGTNISIVTDHGQVTVKGKVGTKHEQRAIAAMVEKQTGLLPANNELEVKKQE